MEKNKVLDSLLNPTGEIKKKKRISGKSRKKNQRKIDLQDIEKGFETIQQDRFEGGTIEKKKDDALFVVDTDGNNETKSKLERWRSKKLTIDKILEPNPNIRTVVKEIPRTSNYQEKLIEKKVRALKNQTSNSQIKSSSKKKKKKSSESSGSSTSVTYDIWGAPPKTLHEEKLESDDFLEHLRKKEIKVPRSALSSYNAITSLVPAVPLPSTGFSYNPTYEAHQDLLGEVIAKEIRKEEWENRVKKQLPKKIGKSFNPEDEVFRDEELLTIEDSDEVHQGSENQREDLVENGEGNEGVDNVDGMDGMDGMDGVDGEEDEEDEEKSGYTAYVDRKTRKERNREKRERQAAYERSQVNLKNRINNQIDKVDKISAELDKKERIQKRKLKARRAILMRKALYGTKRLGPNKFVPDPTPVMFSDELPTHLRQVSNKADPHRQILQSLQRRNLIEVRKKVDKSKLKPERKVKTYEKRNMEVNL